MELWYHFKIYTAEADVYPNAIGQKGVVYLNSKQQPTTRKRLETMADHVEDKREEYKELLMFFRCTGTELVLNISSLIDWLNVIKSIPVSYALFIEQWIASGLHYGI